jgi:hypothetical protein
LAHPETLQSAGRGLKPDSSDRTVPAYTWQVRGVTIEWAHCFVERPSSEREDWT